MLISNWKQVPKTRINQTRNYEICTTESTCESIAIRYIQHAKKNIRINDYELGALETSLFAAGSRGVSIETILSEHNRKTLRFLLGNDIPTWIDRGHNKETRIIIIDDQIVIRKINNAGVISMEIDNNYTVASIYVAEFSKHKKHSMKLENNYD